MALLDLMKEAAMTGLRQFAALTPIEQDEVLDTLDPVLGTKAVKKMLQKTRAIGMAREKLRAPKAPPAPKPPKAAPTSKPAPPEDDIIDVEIIE